MFDLEYMRAANDAERHMDYAKTSDNEFAYGVFSEGSNVAHGIVSILHRGRSGPDIGWLKMLQLDLAPEFDEALVKDDLDKLSEVVEIYQSAISGTIVLGTVHRAKVLKLYGRTAHLLNVLLTVGEKIKTEFAGAVDISKEGRWLVVRVKE